MLFIERRWEEELQKYEWQLKEHKEEIERILDRHGYDLKKVDELEDWIKDIENQLKKQQTDVEQRDNHITDILERISNWQKNFQSRLEKLEKAQKRVDKIVKGKPNVPKGNGQ